MEVKIMLFFQNIKLTGAVPNSLSVSNFVDWSDKFTILLTKMVAGSNVEIDKKYPIDLLIEFNDVDEPTENMVFQKVL